MKLRSMRSSGLRFDIAMPTQTDLDAAKVYTSIMEEAKFRALSINTLTRSQIALPVSLLREFCFLQLRMLCELIALGCLGRAR
jgi:hypothetical protein